jgi:glycosyltransferase involved in cell wall biosynthesis
VLYLQPATDFGGAERQATYSIAGLPRYGIEVIPMVGPDRLIVDELAALGVPCAIHHTGFPADHKAPRALHQRARLIESYIRAFFALSRDVATAAQRYRCQLVFASRPFSWVVGGRAGTRLSLPVVWRAGTLFNHIVQPALLRLSARLWPPRAVVCTSRAVRAALARHVAAPMLVLHNGVDTARFSPTVDGAAARAALGLTSAPTIALVARLSPEKGLRLLIDVCRELQARIPRVQVLVAGDSAWRARFDAACRAAGLDGTVRRLAFVRRIELVYAAADLVMLTSRTEGCSNALLEAMAMGRAVVATGVDGTREIVRDRVDGLLVPPGDPAAFAACVAELMRAPARRAELGRAAAAVVARKFALEVQLSRLAELLHRVAGHEPIALDESELAS